MSRRAAVKAPKAPKSINQAAKIMALAKIESESRYAPLDQRQRFIKNAVAMLGLLLAAFLLYIVGFSQVFHMVNQQEQRNAFREQLAQGIAPTGEVDYNNVMLTQGAPVAVIQIPSIHLDEVVAEGTDSGTLTLGPGHRRDTVMPGQAGTSVLMGRAWAYGGPFNRLQSLEPGTKINVITGQGKSTYEVLGVRYQGDYTLPTIGSGEGRLMLLTSRGAPFMPSGVLRLDAKLVTTPKPVGPVLSNIFTLPKQEREMGFDLRYAWALAFALQFLIIVVLLAVWTSTKIKPAQLYLVFAPLTLFALALVMDQIVKVLPNLL